MFKKNRYIYLNQLRINVNKENRKIPFYQPNYFNNYLIKDNEFERENSDYKLKFSIFKRRN